MGRSLNKNNIRFTLETQIDNIINFLDLTINLILIFIENQQKPI